MLGFDKFWRILSGISQVDNIQISIWCLCSNDMWRIPNTSLQVCLSVQVLHSKAKVRGEGGDPGVLLLSVVLLLSWLQGPLEEGAAVCGQVKVRLHLSTHRAAVCVAKLRWGSISLYPQDVAKLRWGSISLPTGCGQAKVRLHLSLPTGCGQVKVRLHLSTHRTAVCGQVKVRLHLSTHRTAVCGQV